MTAVANVIDAVLEALVLPSFTKLGYLTRRRTDGWCALDSYTMGSRVIVLTGATSGIGLAAAEVLAANGATLILMARNLDKAQATCDRLRSTTGNEAVSVVVADMGDLEAVRRACETIRAKHPKLHALIHNAGALSGQRKTNAQGVELTTAVQVVGPFLMTGLLLDRLANAEGSRVITMSSGGMYLAPLTVDGLQMDARSYKGAEQYARVKRAQVTLNEMWAERAAPLGIRFHALHPGWVDTPGIQGALPGFRSLMRPLLRTPVQGADTLVWLTCDKDQPLRANGRFWLDRRVRQIHRSSKTRRSDIPERRMQLWSWVADAAGWDLESE